MSPTGRPGRRRPPAVPAAAVSAQIRRVCINAGTVEHLDVRRIRDLRLFDIRLPNGNHLRLDFYGRFADVHTREGQQVLGLGGVTCAPEMLDTLIVPSVIGYCHQSVVVPIDDEFERYVGPDETYLMELEERDALEANPDDDPELF